MFEAWSNQQFEDAAARGKAGGQLSSSERERLQKDADLPGERGRKATEALQKAGTKKL